MFEIIRKAHKLKKEDIAGFGYDPGFVKGTVRFKIFLSNNETLVEDLHPSTAYQLFRTLDKKSGFAV